MEIQQLFVYLCSQIDLVMKKKLLLSLLILLCVAIVIFVICRIYSLRVTRYANGIKEFKSCLFGEYHGKIAGLSDYGNIVVFKSETDEEGTPVVVGDDGMYRIELARSMFPRIEYFSFENYHKTIPFVTKNCLDIRMDFDFYDMIKDGDTMKDCRVTYEGDYKDVFDYLNYDGFNKVIFEPTFEKYSNIKAPLFKDYFDEIKSGEQLYINKIQNCSDQSLCSILVSMLGKDVNKALYSFSMLNDNSDPDFEAWLETLTEDDKEKLNI